MRRNHVPWRAAGTTTELQHSADEVVRETGWVFNNRTGRHLSLAEFVETGDHESLAYLTAFGLADGQLASQTLLEIGAGIGRMTASFTRMFARVIACDLDAAFLERCRETVAQFGRPERLQTSHVADGRNLVVPDGTVDLTFCYITLQHCHRDDALALATEAVRVTRGGGHIALNFRTWTASDVALWPAGKVIRA
ncbi:MAG: class I SAM-dependent methyltransferase, partial [Actinomycetota bacterium]|nr:class I SAM-dependent methyltransferase [Actinomycetota bacterium]